MFFLFPRCDGDQGVCKCVCVYILKLYSQQCISLHLYLPLGMGLCLESRGPAPLSQYTPFMSLLRDIFSALSRGQQTLTFKNVKDTISLWTLSNYVFCLSALIWKKGIMLFIFLRILQSLNISNAKAILPVLHLWVNCPTCRIRLGHGNTRDLSSSLI